MAEANEQRTEHERGDWEKIRTGSMDGVRCIIACFRNTIINNVRRIFFVQVLVYLLSFLLLNFLVTNLQKFDFVSLDDLANSSNEK